MFNIYSNKFIKKGIIKNNIRSYNWHELYLDQNGGGGDFEFKIKGDYYKDVIVKGDFIENTKSRKFGVVEEIKKETAADGSVLTTIISGRMGEKLLLQRVIYPQLNLKGIPSVLITDIMNRNVISPSVTSRQMPFVLNFMDISSAELTMSFCGETVGKALYTILSSVDFGYYCSLDIENKQIVLNVFSGTDKTKSVTYSVAQKNIYDYSELSSNKNAFNHVVVKGAVHSNQVPYITSFQKGLAGFDRIEQFLKEESIDNKQLALQDYEIVLKNQGREKLKEGIVEEAYDFAVYNNKYSYNQDMWLGDIITLYSLDLSKTSSQKIIGYLYTRSENGKEEEGFTFQKITELTDDIDVLIELGDKENKDIDSDITTEDTGSGGDGGNKYPILHGYVMCTDNELVRGSVIEVAKDLRRLHIYTWNNNQDVTVSSTDEATGETTSTTFINKVPYIGKIYIASDDDILSHIGVESDTVDIDNFDGSKTRIIVSSARKGVLYRDFFRDGNPLIFENPTEQNANDKVYYEYTIESENLNFNFTIDISTVPVKENVPIKKYNKNYPLEIISGKKNGYKFNDYIQDETFLPANFIADAGDYIEITAGYCPIKHTNDPTTPYVIDTEHASTDDMVEMVYRWEFQQNEKVKNKLIGFPEGVYDWSNGSTWGVKCYFKKFDYIQNYTTWGERAQIGVMYNIYHNGTKWVQCGVNPYWFIKQDPAFDTLEGLTEPRWVIYDRKDTKLPNRTYECGKQGFFLTTRFPKKSGEASDPTNLLEELCSDLGKWYELSAMMDADRAETTE